MTLRFEAFCSSTSCKTLSKVCSVFGKLFEYVILELKHDSMVFSGVNTLKSAFISLQFEHSFFESFQWLDVDQSQANYAFCIKIPSKTIGSLFRGSAGSKNQSSAAQSKGQEGDLFSTISSCKMSFDPVDCKFIISICYSYGMIKSTDIFYEETEVSYPIHKDLSEFEYSVGSPARTMLDWIGCFTGQNKCDEMLFEFDSERAIVGIRSGGIINTMQRTANTSTKLTIKRHQFDEYCIGHVRPPDKITLSISFFDFKMMLLIAASLEADLTIQFDCNVEEPLMFVADECLRGACKLMGIFAKNNPEDSFHSLDAHLNSECVVSAFPTEQEPICQPALVDADNMSGSEEFIPSTPPSKRFAHE